MNFSIFMSVSLPQFIYRTHHETERVDILYFELQEFKSYISWQFVHSTPSTMFPPQLKIKEVVLFGSRITGWSVTGIEVYLLKAM
jgi:hypothetical protein